MKHNIPILKQGTIKTHTVDGMKLFPVKSDFQKNLFGKSKMLTNRNLYSFHKEVISWKQNASIVELAMEDFTERFKAKNAEKINEIVLQMKDLDKRYFQHNDGKIIFGSMPHPEKPDAFIKQPAMNEGFTIEDYNKEFEALMSEPCNVKY